MAVVRYVGASGPATIPMAGRRPRRERQAVTELHLARRHGRGEGANPQPCRSPTTVAEPGVCYLLAHFPRRSTPRQDEDGIRGPTCRHRHDTLDPKQARDHPSFYSLACARFTIACARRTYLLSARSRTVLTPSVSSRASASLLDRPKAVSGASTSSANFIGPDSCPRAGWSRTCRSR